MSGKSTAAIIELAEISHDQIVVDRVELRDGNKLRSIASMLKLVSNVRRRKFDLVIDLHSLPETNLLGLVAGIPNRLYADRRRRSLNWLSNFPVKPAVEDRSKHISQRYADVIAPLGIDAYDSELELEPFSEHMIEFREQLESHGVADDAGLVGMFLGAGHPSRRWPLEKYADLAARIVDDTSAKVLVFLGPEEIELLPEVRSKFPRSAIVFDKLKLLPLFAALTFIKVLVSNDTGPTHLAAATDAWIILISHIDAPDEFRPLTKKLSVINSGVIDEIGVDEVFLEVQQRLKNDKSPGA
ncbi:MAG: glycosyltransferase family 9 protein [Pyrinomonadaceae bacterium]